MLRRYVLRSRIFNAVPLRSYRTRGALGKVKEVEGEWKEKPPKNEAKKPLKSLEKPTVEEKLKKAEKISVIAPGSEQHNDLPSFLDYAKRLELSETSTVYVGTHYEYTVASSLQNLGFDLTRTGRASDYGIDLLGHWNIPSLPRPIRVLLQCKAHSKGLTPAHVRELEGAFPGAPAGWRGGGVMGFLVATHQATKGMRDALIRSHLPMGFLQATAEGTLLQFIWNHEAAKQGLEGMGVTNRFTPQTEEKHSEGNGLEQKIALTWKGWTLSKENSEVVSPSSNTKAKPLAVKAIRTSLCTTKPIPKDTAKTPAKNAIETSTKRVASNPKKPVQARRKN